MPFAVRTGQVGCTGPVKRGKKHISISLKIDDAQYSWITCPEVSVCQCLCCHWKMSRWLSLTTAMNFSVCRQVRCIWLCVALRHLSFSGKLLCWNSFLKTVFGWAANSRKRASDNALHSRVLAFTSKGEEIRRGPELKNTVVCHPSALHQNEGWPPSFVRGSLHASVALSMAAGIKLSEGPVPKSFSWTKGQNDLQWTPWTGGYRTSFILAILYWVSSDGFYAVHAGFKGAWLLKVLQDQILYCHLLFWEIFRRVWV